MEDIDLAPIDVVSVILPLMETRSLFLPSRGEVGSCSDFHIYVKSVCMMSIN